MLQLKRDAWGRVVGLDWDAWWAEHPEMSDPTVWWDPEAFIQKKARVVRNGTPREKLTKNPGLVTSDNPRGMQVLRNGDMCGSDRHQMSEHGRQKPNGEWYCNSCKNERARVNNARYRAKRKEKVSQ